MAEYYEKGAAINLTRDIEGLFNPKGDRLSAKEQLDSFLRLPHEPIREPLIGAVGKTKKVMERIWKEGKANDEYWNRNYYGDKATIAMKLMYCWAKEAHKQERIMKAS
jgi:hypothetical protein